MTRSAFHEGSHTMLLRSARVLASLSLLIACSQPKPNPTPTPESKVVMPSPSPTPSVPDDLEDNGLTWSVRETESSEPAPEAGVHAPTQNLAAKDAERVLARLPKLEAEAGSAQAFALRGPSTKPPTSGSTTSLPFPQPEKAPVAKPKAPVVPLKVSRYAPVGDVPIAAQVGVTFSQPMIEVATVDQANARVPVKLSPSVEGTWRWMGTQTLVFAPAVRLPMATAFTAEIPKGTKSMNGGVLAEAVKWSFATAPLTLQASVPRDDNGVGLEPLVFLGFDQKIDVKTLLEHVEVKAGRASVAVREATDQEIAANGQVHAYVRSAEAGRYLVLRLAKPLPTATKVTVTVPKGTPSAEGPLLTKAPQSFTFSTYGPFKFEEGTCWSDPCRPDSPLVMRFSNSIDSKSYTDSMVVVEPNIPDRQLVVSGNQIQVNGKKKSRTKYTVTIEGALRDVHGQELEGRAKHTFAIADAWPRLQLARSGFVTMTPETPRIDVISAGQPTVHVALYKVQPSDWAAYSEFASQLYHDNGPKVPGTLIRQGDVKVAGSPDDLVATPIDLTAGLDKGRGSVVVVVSGKRQYRSELTRVAAWVQVTPMALDAFSDATDLVAWVTDLKTGAPISGAAIELLPTKVTAKSDGDGVAKLVMPPPDDSYRKRVIVARHGDERVMLPEGQWYANPRGTGYLTWVTDDRGMYKPGETASFKGFVRRLSGAKNASLEPAGLKELKYVVNDPRGSKIADGSFKLSALGGFDFAVKLPDNANLGQASVHFTDGHDHIGYHHFDIQEFRRPEFEVSASVNAGVHVMGQPQSATVKAAYYAGGPLTGAPVSWTVTSSRASFTPPGRDSYIFGTWKPWWYFHHYEERDRLVSTQLAGTTDATGKHSIAIEPKSIRPASAVSIEAQATVTDVNRQAWSARATMLVHAATTYVGVKLERMFVEPGQAAVFDIIAVDLDGKAEKGRSVRIEVERNAARVENGQWHEEVVRETDTTITSGDAPVAWTFKPKEGGRHRVQLTVSDAQGRTNRTELTLWVSGEKRPPVNEVKHDEVTLIPSKKVYEPGETAEVLVQSPFAPADGIVLIERNGILSTERIHIKESSTIVKLPIKEAHAPNVHLAVELVGSAQAPNGKGRRPAYASGALDLAVSMKHLALTVDVVPASRGLEPGVTTEVSATIKDANGRPIEGAEVTIIVVDEAVLALSGFTLRDPLAVMTPHRERGVLSTYIRDSVVLARVESDDADEMSKEKSMELAEDMAMPAAALGMMAPAPMRRMSKREAPGEPEPQIAVRKDFSALAAFVPKLTTNGAGKVTASVKLPDNLTRYRVMAVAAGSVSQFGKGESTITARLPLMVRPSPPRFLNFGDRFELPAVVHNQTEQAMDVDVVARAVNLELTQAGYRVRVEPGQRVEVRFPARTVSAGTARFQIGAVSGKAADAADVSIKVWTPATTESFATYGVLDGNGVIAQPIAAPADVFPQAGGLKVSTASTALQSLTDAVIYLSTYPYACTEQLSSRVLGLTAMKDVLAAFDAEGVPTPKELAASIDADLATLATRQSGSGGFGFWGHDRVSPYASVHATHALLRAKEAGFSVNKDVLARALKYLQAIEKDLNDYPDGARQVVVAYALAVRARAGDADTKRASDLVAKAGLKKVAVEAAGNLLVVAKRGSDNRLAKELLGELERRVTETAASAHFVTHYDDGAHLILASDRRSDAVVLGGLLEAEPASDLVPKVVRGLLDARKKGRWYNTQENVFVLLALGDYFQAFEKQTPEFVARMWLGDDYAGEVPFHGRDTVTRELEVPMERLVTAGKALTLQKQGVGRLYYRIGLDYAPASLELAARDAGFQVQRTYEAVDGADTVRRDADGTWRVKAGARVRVKLEMVAPSVRYHVALVDPMPAGFEALNGALAVSERVPDEDEGYDEEDRPVRRGRGYRHFWWRSQWYEHQNLRDERVEAFGTEVWAGVHTYSYVARATTPGTYVVPPTKAEEMYAPETFGRSASTKVIVE